MNNILRINTIKFLKSNYSQLNKIKKISLLSKNINGKNFLIHSKNGKFVLKYFLDNSKPEKIECMCKILDFCSSSKVEAPIKNKKRNYVDFNEKFYLTKYYESSTPKGNQKEMEDLAFQLAQLHKSLKKTKISFNYKTNFQLYSILKKSELNQIHSKIIKKNNRTTFDKKIIQRFEFLKDCIEYDWEFSQNSHFINYPKQLIHDDLHPRNLLFRNSRLQAFIDFSTLKKGNIIDDVAFCALRFALIKNKKIKKINESMKLFFNLYLNYNSITPKQLENVSFFQSHKILHGLSFIIKNHYFKNFFSWDSDLEKYSNLLKIVKSEELVLD